MPNEFLQCDEFAVDSIIKNFKKTLDAPVFSLPRHNTSSSLALPSELPAQHLSAQLVWAAALAAVRRPLRHHPLRRPLLHTPGRVQRGDRCVSRLKACTTADAAPGNPRRRGRLPGKRPGGSATAERPGSSAAAERPNGSAAAKWVTFAHPLASTPSATSAPRNGPGTVFLPSVEVFARLGPAAPSTSPQQGYPPRQRTPPRNPPRCLQRQRTPPQGMDL